MKCYTNTGTIKTIKRCQELNIGLLIVSPKWVNPDRWPFYAIDNGAYSSFVNKAEWDPAPFLKILNRARERAVPPDFVVLPDIVAGGVKSLEFSKKWLEVLPAGMPYYVAVQDGMTTTDLYRFMSSMSADGDTSNWTRVKGVFVGGTIEWKVKTGHMWSEYARGLNMGCHIGRVGPVNRIVWAEHIGATSIDSTTWVQNKGAIEYVAKARRQRRLTE